MKGVPVTVDSLIRVYRLGRIEVQALRGLSMKVDAGQIVSIIGPSGSGKTTLLNILGGLDRATAGTADVGGVSVTTLSPGELIGYRRNTVGHVFQALNLIPTLTGAENVELPMLTMGMGRNSRRKRTLELLSIVGLADRADHKPDELSGGEQQRVAIAAALANDPPLILADEPTGELDTTNAKVITDFLVKVSKELGKTVVMVTHDPRVATNADRIFRIEDGVIKASLTPAQMTEEKATVSYVDQLRGRLQDVDSQLSRLDEEFRQGRVSGDEYVEQRQRLKQLRLGIQDELQRHGVLT